MRITTCETRTQLIVYSVSLPCLFLFFCDASVFVILFFLSHFLFLVSFSAGSARGEIDDANATPPVAKLGQLPNWDGR